MFEKILKELKNHIPFTALGALGGILLILIFYNLPFKLSYRIFYISHPLHVLLSAQVTTAMYKSYKGKSKMISLLLIGYFGSVGIGTLSDSVIPYLGEIILNLPEREIHLGFIEEWQIVNLLALIGISIGCLWPKTKFPHTGHVLISTCASLFHIIMALGGKIDLNLFFTFTIFVFLFIAVWIPCCFSDIVFPLLFVKSEQKGGVR